MKESVCTRPHVLVALPLNTVPSPLGSMAAGWCVQVMRSRDEECPHVMFCHLEP